MIKIPLRSAGGGSQILEAVHSAATLRNRFVCVHIGVCVFVLLNQVKRSSEALGPELDELWYSCMREK